MANGLFDFMSSAGTGGMSQDRAAMGQTFFNSLSGLGQIWQGGQIARAGYEAQASAIRMGGEIASGGALLNAAAFRNSSKAVAQSLGFNLSMEDVNKDRQLSSLSRQFQQITGQQLVQQAKTMSSIGSKSFLMLQHEAASSFELAMLQTKTDSENRRRSMKYETAIREMELENQARGAEYQAASAKWQAEVDAQQAEYQADVAEYQSSMSIMKGLPSLFQQGSSLFSTPSK